MSMSHKFNRPKLNTEIFCLFLILKLTEGRYGFVPKFLGQDSAIIVDTDKLMPPPSPPPTTPSTPMQQQTNSVNFPTKLRLAPPPFPLWQHFPRYHIIPPPPPGQIISINTWPKAKFQMTKSTTTKPSTTTSTTTTTTSTTTTTTTTVKPKITSTPINNFNTKSKFGIDTVPFVTDDEFPRELLDIAQNKLGLKSLDEIPSISELGQLLGTNSPHETLNYIKKLTANEQGVALMKAYIESTDYTDNADKTYDDEEGDDDDEEIADLGDIEEPLRINDEGLVVITTADEDSNGDYEELNANDKTEAKEEILTSSVNIKNRKTPKIIKKLKEISNAKPGLMERLVNFMHLNNLWQKKTTDRKTNKISEENNNKLNDFDELNRMTIQGKKIEITNETQEPEISTELPILVRDPIPYNYPVPIRRANSTSTTTTPATPSEQPSSTTTSSSTLESSTVVHLNTPKMLIPHVKQLARVTKIPPKKIEDFLASKPKLLELANKVSRFPIGYDRASPLEAQVMMAVQKAIEQDEDLKKLLSSTTTLK